jgi:FAD/FMN-containing dehydrogenase
MLKGVVGDKYVLSESTAMIPYTRDSGIYEGLPPELAVRPGSAEEVSEIVRIANTLKVPIRIIGGATSYTAGALPSRRGEILVDPTRLNRVVEIDDDSNSVTVQAGINWSKLGYELKRHGQMTFGGPGSVYSATIGGGVSCASLGAGMSKYGGIGDWLLGLQVVLPTGEIIRTGSGINPFAKKFCRYGLGPDLTGLFVGDHGIFGIKTEVTLRTYPIPEVKGQVEYGFQTEEDAYQAFCEMADVNEISDTLRFYDADWVKATSKSMPYLEGFTSLVMGFMDSHSKKICEAQEELFDNIAQRHNGKETEGKYANYLREKMHDMYYLARRTRGIAVSAYGQAPLRKALQIMKAYRNFLHDNWEIVENYTSYGGIMATVVSKRHVNIYLALFFPWHLDSDPNAKEIILKFWDKCVDFYIEQGGIHYWVGKLIGDRIYLKVPKVQHEFLKALKETLDPNHVLNPGLFLM